MYQAPPPRFITPRDLDAPTEGRQIAKLARIMGKPLMPWQRQCVDGATEKTALGFYKYSTVMITVPRQSGKTTLVGPVQLHRIMTRPRIKAFFTAQTGKDARERMADLQKMVGGSPIAPLFKQRYAAGSEGMSLANGSQLRVFAPGPAAIHGETPHLVTLDEIWKHDQARGAELMGAIGPAQATLEGHSQVWMISTMGTANSGFMNDWVERGRAGHPGLFFADWGMAEGMDPYEPQTWWSFHPALGLTITEGAMAKEAADQPLGEWLRAYCNTLTKSRDPLIPDDDMAAMVQLPLEVPSRRAIVVSYEVSRDGESAVVQASWRDTDGQPVTRTLHAAPGTSWLIPFLRWIVAAWKPAVLAADDGGETRRITDELRRPRTVDGRELPGLEVYTVGGGDVATACMVVLTALRDKQLRLDGSAAFTSAVSHVALQSWGDGWKFSRKNSSGSIAALMAAVVGLWAFDHQTKPIGKPVTKF